MKANNVIKRIKKISVNKKRKKEIQQYFFKKIIFPMYEFSMVVKKDIEAKNFMIAKQKEDRQKILEIIKRETERFKYGN